MRTTTRPGLPFFLILPFATVPAIADVEIRIDDGGHCDVVLSGAIATADAAALEASECRRAFSFLHDSPGGDAYAGMAIGRWARAREAWITVIVDAQCLSSCALAFIGGVHRSNFGEIGLHRPYLSGEPRSEEEVRLAVVRMLADIRDYVHDLGVSPEFASVVANTPPSEMRRYHREAIYELVPTTDATHEEVEVAKNAERYGLTTDEYRRREAEAERECEAMKFNDVTVEVLPSVLYECRQAIYWGLSRLVYQQRRSEAVERCNRGNSTPEEAEQCGVAVMKGAH